MFDSRLRLEFHYQQLTINNSPVPTTEETSATDWLTIRQLNNFCIQDF